MLADLLAPDSVQNLHATYGQKYERLFNKAALVAHWLFNYGTRFQAGRIDTTYDRAVLALVAARWKETVGERLWVDAEDYLDYLDTSVASDASRAARQVERLTSPFTEQGAKPTRAELAAAARR